MSNLINHPLVVGGGSITAIQLIQQVDPSQAVNLISTIVIAIATLIKMFKKEKK